LSRTCNALPFKADFNVGEADPLGAETDLRPPIAEEDETTFFLGEIVTVIPGGAIAALVEDVTSLWLLEDFLLLDLLLFFELFDRRRS
jgi:hypothetical protein